MQAEIPTRPAEIIVEQGRIVVVLSQIVEQFTKDAGEIKLTATDGNSTSDLPAFRKSRIMDFDYATAGLRSVKFTDV